MAALQRAASQGGSIDATTAASKMPQAQAQAVAAANVVSSLSASPVASPVATATRSPRGDDTASSKHATKPKRGVALPVETDNSKTTQDGGEGGGEEEDEEVWEDYDSGNDASEEEEEEEEVPESEAEGSAREIVAVLANTQGQNGDAGKNNC